MKIDNIPYFAIVGAVAIISMILYTTNSPSFMSVILPTYLTEAIAFIALGYVLLGKHKGGSFAVFLMTAIWLFNQILWWSGFFGSGVDTTLLTMGSWLSLLAELGLVYVFMGNKSPKYVDSGSVAWAYASYFVLFIFGAAKAILVIAGNTSATVFFTTPALKMTLWGIGIVLLSLGYIVRPMKSFSTIGKALLLIGTLLAVIGALTINSTGLSLLP